MKKLMSKLCLFDLILVLLAVCAGAFLWMGLHGEKPAANPSAAWFLEDIHRGSERYTKQESLKVQKQYCVSVIVRTENISADYAENYAALETGMQIFEHYSGTALGELEEFAVTENDDGTLDTMLRIKVYSNMDSVRITTPAGVVLCVEQSLCTAAENGAYLGMGTVTWISH